MIEKVTKPLTTRRFTGDDVIIADPRVFSGFSDEDTIPWSPGEYDITDTARKKTIGTFATIGGYIGIAKLGDDVAKEELIRSACHRGLDVVIIPKFDGIISIELTNSFIVRRGEKVKMSTRINIRGAGTSGYKHIEFVSKKSEE